MLLILYKFREILQQCFKRDWERSSQIILHCFSICISICWKNLDFYGVIMPFVSSSKNIKITPLECCVCWTPNLAHFSAISDSTSTECTEWKTITCFGLKSGSWNTLYVDGFQFSNRKNVSLEVYAKSVSFFFFY